MFSCGPLAQMLKYGKKTLSHLFMKEPNNPQTLGASIELFVLFTYLLLLYLLCNLLCLFFLMFVSLPVKLNDVKEKDTQENKWKKQRNSCLAISERQHSKKKK